MFVCLEGTDLEFVYKTLWTLNGWVLQTSQLQSSYNRETQASERLPI